MPAKDSSFPAISFTLGFVWGKDILVLKSCILRQTAGWRETLRKEKFILSA